MEIATQLKSLAEKINRLKDQIETEESTKHAFVLPFIQILGYDTFNPLEVHPEFTADIGIKKGEKVDYAIYQNGAPILIIECKNWRQDLTLHNSQLFRYFHVSKTRFSLLTNGIIYKFYTDLEEKNKMDTKPFLEFDITNLKESTIREIEKFHKSKFDVNSIVDNASNLKYTKELKRVIDSEIASPSQDFVRLLTSQVYSGRMTANVIAEFTDLVQKAFGQIISDKVNDRLKQALTKEEEKQKEEEMPPVEIDDDGVDTTDEELEGYRVVVAILRRKVPIERITYRDNKTYFNILLDDNRLKPLCRLHFNTSQKYIGIFDENKKEEREKIDSVDDIYNFEDRLLSSLDLYEE